MFCSKCGAEVKVDDSYCRSCGHPLKEGADHASTLTNKQDVESSEYDKQLRLFVGGNASFYMKKWDHFLFPHKYAGWNWAAFFLGPVWFAYRKMYSHFFIIYGMYTLVSAVSLTNNLIFALVGIMSVFIPYIIGSTANKLYYNHARRQIKQKRQGGTSLSAALLVLVLEVAIAVIYLYAQEMYYPS